MNVLVNILNIFTSIIIVQAFFSIPFNFRTERREDEDLSTDPPPPLPEEEPDGKDGWTFKGTVSREFHAVFPIS